MWFSCIVCFHLFVYSEGNFSVICPFLLYINIHWLMYGLSAWHSVFCLILIWKGRLKDIFIFKANVGMCKSQMRYRPNCMKIKGLTRSTVNHSYPVVFQEAPVNSELPWTAALNWQPRLLNVSILLSSHNIICFFSQLLNLLVKFVIFTYWVL